MESKIIEINVPTPCPKCDAGMYSVCYKNSPITKLNGRYRSLIICKECAYETSGELQELRMVTI